jgi:hypothetical protein
MAVEEFQNGYYEDLSKMDDHTLMIHSRVIRKQAGLVLKVSQEEHPNAWNEFSIKVHTHT